jgi:dTDP-4-amino-4,6-dideoxygalactose transaminase
MYRNNDLTAAFGRAQLTKLDGYLAHQAANAQRLTEALVGTPGLILPEVPEGFTHNWYNYVLRFDFNVLAEQFDGVAEIAPRDLRDKIVAALNAEGVNNGVWQRFILPAMTVFQAKNGYGKGCPWDCPHAGTVDYNLDQYPAAQRHCDTHTCISMALRSPNGAEVVDCMAAGIRKVMANLDQVLVV